MPMSKGMHLTRENRKVIERGLYEEVSCRGIAAMIDVSPSTVSREVRQNRHVSERPRRPGAKLAVRCARYRDCEASATACKGCPTAYTSCRNCRTHSCIDTCPDYVRKMCPVTESWPYVCPSACQKRGRCGYPKCSYDAARADDTYRSRLRDSRSGAGVTADELAGMDALVTPLVRQGQSFEAIWPHTPTSFPWA